MRIKKFDMNLTSVTALGIASVVGAGIFALLGQVTMLAGTLTYYAFIIAGTAALFSGYSYGKLAGTYPDSGGLTDYFHIAFKSKLKSGTFTIIYLLTSAISISMMAKSFGIYAAHLFPEFNNSTTFINLCAGSLIVGMAVLNMLRASDVGRTEILLVAIKMSILLALIAAALLHPNLRIEPLNVNPSASDFMSSIGITFFAFAGYGIITNAAGDVQDPKKTIARSIYLTILIVILLYVWLAFVVLNYIPQADLLKNADTAVAVAAKKLLGSAGFGLIYFAAVIAFVSGISATYFSIFRISYSLSQQKILPRFYHIRFWRRGTFGNLLTVSLILIATISFNFNLIVNLSSAAYLVSYMAIFVANWKLRKETKSSPTMIITGFILMFLMLIGFVLSIV